MLLSARFLVGVASVNSFNFTERLSLSQGDATTIYFQLVDQSLDLASAGFNPPFRRYSVASGATLQVVLDNLDSNRVITKTATVPFAGDRSIWSFPITASDALLGTVTMRLTLTEGAVISNGVLNAGLSVFAK